MMILKEALANILVDLNSYQHIQIITSKDNESIIYTIGIAMINGEYVIRIEADEYITVHNYSMNTVEKANSKLQWIMNKYSLTVKSIVYVTNMQLNELLVKCFKDYRLSYTIETKRITNEEMLICYTTITHPIDYKNFINDFEEVSNLVKETCRKYGIELVLRQENPLTMVRRLKLESIDIH